MLYWILWALSQLALRAYFRRIEVEGREHIPPGPVLFVPNHSNALVDPLVLTTSMNRRLTVTAKNVLAKNPLLAGCMAAAGVIVFHRREDAGKGADPRENVNALRRCRNVLAEGGALCVFPEGISHSDPQLRPFRTGPVRIAFDYVCEDGNPGGLGVVPVGLLYTEKDQFRSDVWLRYGEPIDVDAWLAAHPQADVREFTNEIERRVRELTLNFATRRESAVLTWAAEIVATGGEMPPPLNRNDGPVADRFRLIAKLQAGYHELTEECPEEIATLSARIRAYRKELKQHGLEPPEVYLPMHAGRALLFAVREFELLVVGLPMALFGIINHAIPYWIVKRIARRLSTDKDHWASNAIYPSFVVFPFFYILQLIAAWWFLPVIWAALYTVALPYTGYYALLYRDRAGSVFRRTRTFLRFLFDRSLQSQFADEGRAIVARIAELAARLPPQEPSNGVAIERTSTGSPRADAEPTRS